MKIIRFSLGLFFLGLWFIYANLYYVYCLFRRIEFDITDIT